MGVLLITAVKMDYKTLKMSKDTYSAPDEVSLASTLNAKMYLCYLLCRVILLFFGHSRQNCCRAKN
jgi:hypothetical protein